MPLEMMKCPDLETNADFLILTLAPARNYAASNRRKTSTRMKPSDSANVANFSASLKGVRIMSIQESEHFEAESIEKLGKNICVASGD